MTTTVTVRTHSWPVKVVTTDEYCRNQKTSGIDQEVHSVTTTEETVPPNNERHFHITSNRSIAFHELPIPVVEDPEVPEELETLAPEETPAEEAATFEDAVYEPELADKVKSD